MEPRGGDDDPTVVAPVDDPTVVAPGPSGPDTTPTPAFPAPEPPPTAAAPPQVGSPTAPPAAAPAPPSYPQPSYPQPSYPQPSYPQPSYPQPSYPQAPAGPVAYAAPAPAAAFATAPPRHRRPVAGALVFTGAALFAWYVAGAVANLGVDVLKPSVFVELAGVRVFAPAALVCFALAWWLRAARSVAAGVVVTLVGAGLVAYAVWQSYRDWRFLIGSVQLAGAAVVLLGGLGGLRRAR